MPGLKKYPLYNEPDFQRSSYSNKGQLLGVVLDIVLRDATDNRASPRRSSAKTGNEQYAQQGRFYGGQRGSSCRDGRSAADGALRRKIRGSPIFLTEYVAWHAKFHLPPGLLARPPAEERGQKRAAFGFGLSRNRGGSGGFISDLDSDSAAAGPAFTKATCSTRSMAPRCRAIPVRWLRGHQPGDSVSARTHRGGVENNVSFALTEETGTRL